MKLRLKVLLDSNVISENTYNTVLDINEKFFNNDDFSKEKLDTFFTHLAMTLERMAKKEEIEDLDNSIVDDIKKSTKYEASKKFLNTIENDFDISFNDAERHYLLLHIVNIFNDKEDL